jgi:hypothetical protein
MERFFSEPHSFETSRNKQIPSDVPSFPGKPHNLQLLTWQHNPLPTPTPQKTGEFHYNLANDGCTRTKHT